MIVELHGEVFIIDAETGESQVNAKADFMQKAEALLFFQTISSAVADPL